MVRAQGNDTTWFDTYSSFRSIAYRLHFVRFVSVPCIVGPSLIYVFRVQISRRRVDTFKRDCQHTAAGVRTDNTLWQFTAQIQFANDVGPRPPLSHLRVGRH